MDIRLIQSLEEAEKLWRLATPNETIYDDWAFRLVFYTYFNYPLYFYAAFEGERLVGLLPLQHNTDLGHLEFFAGSYMEDNRIFAAPGFDVQELFRAITLPAKLEYIKSHTDTTAGITFQDYKYVLPLAGLATFEDYLGTYLDMEARGKMRRKIRKLERDHGAITVYKNNLSDLEKLIEYNKENFGDHSSFNDRPHHSEIFRDLLCMQYPVFLFTYALGDRVVGVSMALLYNGVYEYFNLGVDMSVPGIATYVSSHNMQAAIDARATSFDAFTGDYGWKEHWHFPKTAQYQYTTV